MKNIGIIIKWKDSAIHGRDSFTREEAQKLGLVTGLSCGILVHEDKQQITIAMDYFVEDDLFRCISSYNKKDIESITRKKIK